MNHIQDLICGHCGLYMGQLQVGKFKVLQVFQAETDFYLVYTAEHHHSLYLFKALNAATTTSTEGGDIKQTKSGPIDCLCHARPY